MSNELSDKVTAIKSNLRMIEDATIALRARLNQIDQGLSAAMTLYQSGFEDAATQTAEQLLKESEALGQLAQEYIQAIPQPAGKGTLGNDASAPADAGPVALRS